MERPVACGEPVGPGVGRLAREGGCGAGARGVGGAVGALRLVAQGERLADALGPARLFQAGLPHVPLAAPGVECGGAPEGVLVALPAGGPLLLVLQGAVRGGLPGFRRAQGEFGRVAGLAGPGAGHGGPGQHGGGEAGVAGRALGGGPAVGGASRRLGHAVGDGEELPVARLDLLRGGAPLLGEAFLDGSEAAGVEEPAEESAAGFGVGAQEAGEVALREQHHLAELFAVHAEELADLLADLLVGAAEPLPGVGPGVVCLQQ